MMILLLVSNCASSKQEFESSLFTFTIEGHSYQIVSLNSKSGEGLNILKSGATEKESIYARDINQDGNLDVVLYGDQSLEALNMVYQKGIEIASSNGMLEERLQTRVFDYETITHIYQITGMYIEGYTYNIFTMIDKATSIQRSFTDFMADGTIDQDEISTEDLSFIQQHYQIALFQGIAEDRIKLKNGMYEVQPNIDYPPGPYINSKI